MKKKLKDRFKPKDRFEPIKIEVTQSEQTSPIICQYCFYSRKHHDAEMVKCHRYPLTSSAKTDHWCGEFKKTEN